MFWYMVVSVVFDIVWYIHCVYEAAIWHDDYSWNEYTHPVLT